MYNFIMIDEDKIAPGAALFSEAPKTAYKDDELAAATVEEVAPFKNKKITKLTATVFNQWYTSSCVFHAFLTSLEYLGIITKKEVKSQLLAYRKRINYPNEGSIAYDAWDVIRNGVSPYKDGETKEKMTEAAANAMKVIAGLPVLKDLFNHFEITDYTRIPGYVAAGKPVPVFIYATEKEWAQEYVDIKTPSLKIGDAYVRHAVVLVPKGDFTEKGVQRFAVHDSAAFGNRQLRYVSYDFILKRSHYAGRLEKKGEVVPVEPPVVDRTPDVACELNDRGDAVLALQRFLFDQGKLQAQYVTGFYGALTAKAVLWYQLSVWEKFSSTIPELLDLKGEFWGAQSIASLTK